MDRAAAFLLWPHAALQLAPRALHHLTRTLTKENPTV
jgi:hypothetical protein